MQILFTKLISMDLRLTWNYSGCSVALRFCHP